MSTLPARYFDGHSSRSKAALIRVEPGRLVIAVENAEELRIASTDLQVDEPLGAVRRIGLPAGAHLEVPRSAALDTLLTALGHHETLVSRSQRSLGHTLGALVLLVLLGIGGYLWGLPLLAELVAPRLPDTLVAQIDQSALSSMEQAGMLKSSWLDPTRKARLQQGLTGLGLTEPLELRFQRMPGVGPNAFALPGGSVVLGDELVALAPDDAHVLAVLAHEAGHVHYRHGLRMLIQGSVTAIVVSVWLGDFSSAATALSTLALNNRYTREFELEADAFAVRSLQQAGHDGRLLAAMLQRLEASQTGKGRKDKPKDAAEHDGPAMPDWLSTHPATKERIARIEALAASR